MNNMTKFRPINKYIVISKVDEQLKTDSGLLLSQEDAKGFRYMKALVISVGHEVHTVKKANRFTMIRALDTRYSSATSRLP
jgi:co-chaperonin GroES (HSP10)